MITKDKGIEIFCIIDEFDKNLSEELSKNLRLPSVGKDGIRHRNRPGRLSESEIMTIPTISARTAPSRTTTCAASGGA